MRNLAWLLVIACMLMLVVVYADEADAKSASASTTGKAKKTKDWNKINMNDLDKEWESGDESAELEDEFEKNRKIQAAKQPKVDINDGAAIQRAYKADPFAFSGGGGQMVFVDLVGKQPNGKAWTKNDVDQLAKRFASMLKSGSIPANVYNIDTDRILVHIDKPWQVKDMLNFLAQQREVKQFTANSKTYTPKEWRQQFGDADDDDDDDEDL